MDNISNSELDDNIRKVFSAITCFVLDLKDSFKEFMNLKLYNRILEKTNTENTLAVLKNVGIFKDFYNEYKSSINNDDFSFLDIKKVKLMYSENIYIDLFDIWALSNNSEKILIKQHFYNIFMYLDPESNCKNILFKYGVNNCNKEEIKDTLDSLIPKEMKESNEGKFVVDMIGELNNNLDLENISNPVFAVVSLFQSGFITKMSKKLQNDVENKTFDVEKLLDNFKLVVSNSKLKSETIENNLKPELKK